VREPVAHKEKNTEAKVSKSATAAQPAPSAFIAAARAAVSSWGSE